MPDRGDAGVDAGSTLPDAGPEGPAALGGLLVISDSTDESSPANLKIVEPDGGLVCQITNDTNFNRNAGWSADGTKIVWNVRNATGGIWIMASNGDNPMALTPLPSWAFGPAFSPDGTHITYSDYYGVTLPPADGGLIGIEVWVMNADGSNKQRLTTTTVNGTTEPGTVIRWSCRPAYSPDGTKIVYSSTQSGRAEIWVMNSDGTNPTQLTFDTDPAGPDANFPSFSPDGTKIVFLCGFETQYGNICVMNADGSGRTQLTRNPDDGLQMNEPSSDEPAWSPDGKSIIYDYSNQVDPALGLTPTSAETWIMNADGSNQRVLFPRIYGEGRNPWINDPAVDGGPAFECNH